MKRWIALSAASLACFLLLLAVPIPAGAQTNTHCGVLLHPGLPGKPSTSIKINSGCFVSEAKVKSATLQWEQEWLRTTNTKSSDVNPAVTYPLITFFDDVNETGASITYYADTTCDAAGSYGSTDMRYDGSGFNDRADSAQIYCNRQFNAWADPNYTGVYSIISYPTRDSFGSYNDTTSSWNAP